MLDERNEEDAAAAAAAAVAAAAAAALAASAKDERARLKASLLSQYDIASGEEEELVNFQSIIVYISHIYSFLHGFS